MLNTHPYRQQDAKNVTFFQYHNGKSNTTNNEKTLASIWPFSRKQADND